MAYDSVKGWEVLFCIKCGYAIDKCEHTVTWDYCPLCTRKGQQSKLEVRYVRHAPVNEIRKVSSQR